MNDRQRELLRQLEECRHKPDPDGKIHKFMHNCAKAIAREDDRVEDLTAHDDPHSPPPRGGVRCGDFRRLAPFFEEVGQRADLVDGVFERGDNAGEGE